MVMTFMEGVEPGVFQVRTRAGGSRGGMAIKRDTHGLSSATGNQGIPVLKTLWESMWAHPCFRTFLYQVPSLSSCQNKCLWNRGSSLVRYSDVGIYQLAWVSRTLVGQSGLGEMLVPYLVSENCIMSCDFCCAFFTGRIAVSKLNLLDDRFSLPI